MTKYFKNKIYTIHKVDFNKSPKDFIVTKGDVKMNFCQFYKEKYNIEIKDFDQPLLVHYNSKYKTEAFFLPEICFLTGVDKDIKSNMNLLKDLTYFLRGDARAKLEESANVIRGFTTNEDSKTILNYWDCNINKNPLDIEAVKLSPGYYIMAKQSKGVRSEIQIDDTKDLDRKVQTEMYSQPPLHHWAVII